MSALAGALDDPRYHRRDMDSDSERGGDSDEDMGDDDLFGNDEGVEDVRENRRSTTPTATASGDESERLATPEREHRHAMEYGEEDEAAQEIPGEVKEANVTFPNLPVPKSSDGNTWVIRTPNYVNIDSKPFHPDTYIGPDQEDEDANPDSSKERSMSIKLKVENTLRWRWTKDQNGQDKRESNARIIRWSDGSLSLRLGKEIFDVQQSLDTSAGAPRQLGASSQPTSTPKPPANAKNQGLTYLVAQHKRSQVLQAEAVITGFMSLRPTGMQTETHRMLVKAVGQKHNKVARLKVADMPEQDPEKQKADLAKQSARKPRKREDNDGLGGGRRKRYSRRDHDVWSDDDDDEVGVFAGSDNEDERRSPKKGKRKSGMEDEGDGHYQEDGFVVADESDDDGGYNKKRKKTDDLDQLERIEAQIEAQNRGKQDDTDDEDRDAMDVESEEEDEEVVTVRRSTGGHRRRVNFDEDEEE